MFVDIGPYPETGERHIAVEIDDSDIWGMDVTLAYIIVPMLKKLNLCKQGSPHTDDIDVPDNLKSTSAASKENEWDTDEFHFDRWDWIMNEMIWAFEQIIDEDNDSQFHSGVHDISFVKVDPEDENSNYEMKRGPNDTHVFNRDAWEIHNHRITRGTSFFGKYYRALWD